MRVEDKKLLAALLASQKGLKLDYKEIARMYGEGATYNSIEHKFRAFRKEAEALPQINLRPPLRKRGRPPKNGKTPGKDALKTPAKKKPLGSPQASDDESASPAKRRKTKSPRKGVPSVDTSGFNNNASSKAANELDTLMRETSAYSVLGLGADEA
ncbi:hypothetical protein N7450_005016 [Penicillium hetheringtonii]|uniref:Uncharacterized protein n=1 Tax=Penicillium hetheringtonii TaxID=911720 RepID=A0AAD6GWV7_9EURO|nr:hypothetical protein N7450_005016 [Penicillium hetheringtonii]